MPLKAAEVPPQQKDVQKARESQRPVDQSEKVQNWDRIQGLAIVSRHVAIQYLGPETGAAYRQAHTIETNMETIEKRFLMWAGVTDDWQCRWLTVLHPPQSSMGQVSYRWSELAKVLNAHVVKNYWYTGSWRLNNTGVNS